MESIDIEKYTADELDIKIVDNLVNNRKSFQVVAVTDIPSVVNKIEGRIEKQSLKCRVYTEYRSAAITGVVVPTGVTQITGLFSAVGIGVHNIFTFNPDYEIAKNKFNNTVTANYKRDS